VGEPNNGCSVFEHDAQNADLILLALLPRPETCLSSEREENRNTAISKPGGRFVIEADEVNGTVIGHHKGKRKHAR
jgi:hypothetical protein